MTRAYQNYETTVAMGSLPAVWPQRRSVDGGTGLILGTVLNE